MKPPRAEGKIVVSCDDEDFLVTLFASVADERPDARRRFADDLKRRTRRAFDGVRRAMNGVCTSILSSVLRRVKVVDCSSGYAECPCCGGPMFRKPMEGSDVKSD